MQILRQACGAYETNCYILSLACGEFIIDPGDGAFEFLKKNVKNPRAILCTHGHFDHIWDNVKIRREFKIPLFIHEKDEIFLKDPFDQGFEQGEADFLIKDENEFEISGTRFIFHHFPGHTPGCAMIEVVGENIMFSGDFLFFRSIGRWDFPYSNAKQMEQSLQKALKFKDDFILFPGHGQKTSLHAEQLNLPSWLNLLKSKNG